MDWDEAIVARWLEPLASRPGDFADVFGERLRELSIEWRDGEAGQTRVRLEEGVGARWRTDGQERLVFVAGASESSVREAVRALRESAGREPLPIRPSRAEPDSEPHAWHAERWARRLSAILARHAPRHRFELRIRDTERRVTSAGLAGSSLRRLLSLEGSFTAASRAGDEDRPFAFHAPVSDTALEELRAELAAAAAPRDRATPVPGGETDVLLGGGCAAVLFHEILGHPLEADAEGSPFRTLPEARVAVSDLEVVDDATRLDLFGGYDRDDEGTTPRPIRLLHAGHVGARLTDRAHASGAGSTGHGRRAGPADGPLPRGSNIVVGAGAAAPEELLRRLGNGIWIEEFAGGSVDIAGATFRLQFPRARRVRRGRPADELGAGILAGELLPTLRGVEPVVGREVHLCHSLGWCSRGGQVLPVGGAAPDILIRRLTVRSAP